MQNTFKPLYEDPREYYIQNQLEKVKFEEYQIRSQLTSVNSRLSLLEGEFQSNSLLFLGILILYAISFFLLQLPSIPLKIIMSIPYAISTLALFFLSPVLVYRAVHGFVLYQLNMHSERYLDLMKNWNINTYEEERRKCQSVLIRYERYHAQLDKWLDQCHDKTLSLTKEQIQEETSRMVLGDKIPFTNPFTGKLAILTNIITGVMWFLPLIIALAALISLCKTI